MRCRFAAVAALFALAITNASAQAPPTPACESTAHRAFDFWIGEWDAYVAGTEQLAGRSSITLEDGRCVITERWQSQRAAYSGRSLNIYDEGAGHWRQFWVDSSGSAIWFVGDASEDGMVLTAEDPNPGEGRPRFQRMIFTHNSDGTVRQHGLASDDGAEWRDQYDFIYRPRG